MMIPSAPLSSRALALISFPDLCPTRVTLKTMGGDRIFQIVSPGTGVESRVSNKEALWELESSSSMGVSSWVVVVQVVTGLHGLLSDSCFFRQARAIWPDLP